MVFSIGPLALELVLLSVFLLCKLDLWYVLVLFGTIAVYVWFTFKVTEYRVKLRREMNEQDTDAAQKAIDSLLNFETVKYFGAEAREAKRYDAAMAGYEAAALKTSYSLAALNFGQALLITAGLTIVMVMAGLQVRAGALTVGDFVMVNAVMIQITMPLNFLGTVYREIRQALVDMGQMFDLLEQPIEITTKHGAPDLKVTGGSISLRNIAFSYEADRQILRDVSLEIPAGQTVAIVGSSGSGKSTNAKHCLSALVVTSNCANKCLTMDKMNAIHTLLEAFGHSRTIMNSNATRFVNDVFLVELKQKILCKSNLKAKV